MPTKEEKFGRRNGRNFRPFLLAMILLTSTLTNVLAQQSTPWNHEDPLNWNQDINFHPQANQSHINSTESSMIEVPANHTLTSAEVELSPIWQSMDSRGTVFESKDASQWNGSYNQTALSSLDNNLKLKRNNSIEEITDFETTSIVPSDGWFGNGPNDESWTIIPTSSTPPTSQSGMNLPTEGFNASGFLSTSGLGDLSASMHSCLRSPNIDIPRVIKNYSISFDHWLALDSSDAVWVEILDINGNWVSLTPSLGGIQQNNLQYAPNLVWNGESNSWNRVELKLDSYVSSLQSTLNLQFCFETSNLNSLRGGWFIDELSVYNEGESQGTWFHGNLAGDYLPNANSKFTIPLNFTSIPTIDELEISMNWDLQGYLYDYITVEYSIDNGTSWNSLSGTYGIPGTGIWHNGNLYYGESNGWIPIYMPLNYNFANSPALNNTLLRFSAYTDSTMNFGGTQSSEWEGIAVDNIVFHSGRRSTNPSSQIFNNFTNSPNLYFGSQDGWVTNFGGTSNQWQWTDTLGVNSHESTNFSFDLGENLPAGWGLLSIDNKQWKVGTTSNATGFGPGFWPSGQQGAGIFLNSAYQNEMLTHLYSPEYVIPVGASSRLSFKSWVCTEANWDGGAISISTDGGLNWWYIPPTIGTFHDQISTINSNSPFFGEGIFDGSTVQGGCLNTIHPFENKIFDTSNLSGNNIKFRFSFFSDQLLEFDGWYIDDAGLEIDTFEPQGTWTSSILSPDPIFGWGNLDGFVSQPENTTISFDILDINNNTIVGYSNRTLPLDIQLNPTQYQNLRIQANLSTSNVLVSPSIESLSIGFSTYFDAYHFKNMNGDSRYSGAYTDLDLDSNDRIVANQASYIRILTTSFCPQIGAQMYSLGDNISLFSSQFNLVSTYFNNINMNSRLLNFSNNGEVSQSLSDSLQLTLLAGQRLDKFVYHPVCAEAPQSPEIGLGEQNQSIFSWPIDNSGKRFGMATNFSSASSDTTTNFSESDGSVELELLDGQQIEVSYRILQSVDGLNNGGSIDQTPTSFLIELSSQESEASLNHTSINGALMSTTSEQLTVQTRFNSPEACPAFTFPDGLITTEFGIASCFFEFTAKGNITVRFSNLQAISPLQKIQLTLDDVLLHEVRNQSYHGNNREILHIPMHVETSSGSININMTTTSYLHQIDEIQSVSADRWLPEQAIIINSTHVRFNPVIMSEQNYQLSEVKLIISPTSNTDDSVIEIEASNLYSTKDFTITKGIDYVQILDNQSIINCMAGFCQIEWALSSTWELDDIDDIHWMVISTDSLGLQTGPDLIIRETGFNEVENDLEIIQFAAFDSQNALHDWTDADWPFHLQFNESINVSGKVRFQGVSNTFIQPNHALIEVRLEAIPPKNTSGGPDYWLGSPVEWNNSWFVESGNDGYFSTIIFTPGIDIMPSNTSLQISVHISRRGPITQQSETSIDMTAGYQKTKILFDIESPEMISLEVLDPDGLKPADGHIWMSGQDIPLRAIIADVEGLSPSITVWSWSEYKDDVNTDGIMDEEEYVSSTLTLNTGSKSATVDLPILSWYDVRGPFESGRLSIVIKSQDLAGNPLYGGGEFGESSDLATLIVENQYPTYFDFTSITLDLVEQQILPGKEHILTFSLMDANGIDSIDQFQFALLGRDKANDCYIHYSPRFLQTTFDEFCFELEPVIMVIQQDELQIWDVVIKFRLSWDMIQSTVPLEGIPSIKIFDEGQDLQLGVSLLTMFEWTVNENIKLSTVDITESSEQIGLNTDENIWAQSNDIIQLNLQMTFTNLTNPVEFLTDDFNIIGEINGQSANILFNTTIINDGSINTEFIVDPSVAINGTILLEIHLFSPQLEDLAALNYQVYIDDSPPMLSLNLKNLLQIDSNRLFEIPINATISDDLPLNNQQLYVNWYFSNNNTMIQGTRGNTTMISSGISQFNTYFNQTIDITPADESLLTKDSEVIIWFATIDNSGLALTGFATINEPLLPRFNWVDFEPKLDIVSIKTNNPVFGENIEILTRIVNIGQLNGTVQVDLTDKEGLILETKYVLIESGDWVETMWYVEAWKIGDIMFFVNLTNYSQSKTVEVEDVQEFDSSNKELNGLIGLIGLLIFLMVGAFGFAYHRRSKQLEQYTKLHIENVVQKRRSAPPRPLELDDLNEEE